jgi:pyruvate/2-oxoglutarate dehydrogenase complex dihydrolipoamide dehydrogenase (E3) component
MTEQSYDLIIIGAGSGGLVAARFAAHLGARVALVEKDHIGGDCTWTGCVPSKALLKAAKVAHEVRNSSHCGITCGTPVVDMSKVRQYVRSAIQQVYRFESPEELQREGIDVFLGAARFLDSRSIFVGDRTLRSKKFLLTTGARPFIPAIPGLDAVPFITYEKLFEIDELPKTMLIVGGGPIGMEIAQAYQRLGSQVVVVADRVLPKEDADVRELMRRVFEKEGVRFLLGRAKLARMQGNAVVIATDNDEARGDLLLVASGRKPTVTGLHLEKAGVKYSEKGIPVDNRLRTNVKHIYAAGDVVGGHQFTHFAGWQAFQAVRNALLPGSSSGFTTLVPRVTFTDPEVASVGATERQARADFGDNVKISKLPMDHTDRAVCENDQAGLIKLITERGRKLLGATIVAGRAGEAISELVVAIRQKIGIAELAGTIHAYPTYSTAIQQLAAEMTTAKALSGTSGKVVHTLLKLSTAGKPREHA